MVAAGEQKKFRLNQTYKKVSLLLDRQDTVIYMKFQRIKDLREDSDLTQKELGEKLNLPQRTYAYYESGERTIPPEILIKIADFYHTSIDYILGRTDKK